MHEVLQQLQVMVTSTIRMRGKIKNLLRDFERGIIVGARWAGLNISKNADFQEFYTQNSPSSCVRMIQ